MAQDKWDCPYMPRQSGTYHHTHHSRHSFVHNAAAFRPVLRSEIRAAGKDGAPQKAMDHEWARLLKQGCFDFSEVFETRELTAQARSGKRKPCHIGLVFGICVEKAYLHKEGDPNFHLRKFKGRYV